ncbi:MAG: hypothetical protein AAF414_12680 [Pseudomonadota bacterium]
MLFSIGMFKRLIVVTWALWWVIAFLTDFLGAFENLGWASFGWLQNGNYPAIVQAIAPFDPPSWLSVFLFAGVICWSFLSAVFLSIAALAPSRPRERWMALANIGFVISMAEWFAFLIADQIVQEYDLEGNHMEQAGVQLLCFIALHILPVHNEDDRAA